jgi:hypothetical protein
VVTIEAGLLICDGGRDSHFLKAAASRRHKPCPQYAPLLPFTAVVADGKEIANSRLKVKLNSNTNQGVSFDVSKATTAEPIPFRILGVPESPFYAV